MDPFILSRNAFHIYCSEYVNTNSSTTTTTNQSIIQSDHSDLNHEKAVCILNQRYEYFLQTLDRLRTSFEQTTKNHNINSISNSEKDTLTLSVATSNKKHLNKSNKRRMPKIFITVSCTEHLTQQQPNIKMY
jgi:hypothetical protein